MLSGYDTKPAHVTFGNVADKFCLATHLANLRAFLDKLSRRYVMPFVLFTELQSYGALSQAMQLLESWRHVVNVLLSHGCAGQIGCLSAAMRRKINADVRLPHFKDNLERYVACCLDVLPPMLRDQFPHSERELHRVIHGSHLLTLHGNVVDEHDVVDKYRSSCSRETPADHLSLEDASEYQLVLEYARAIMPKSCYFVVETNADDEREPADAVDGSAGGGGGDMRNQIVYQLVSAFPEGNANIEKLSHLPVYGWHGCAAISNVMIVKIEPGLSDTSHTSVTDT